MITILIRRTTDHLTNSFVDVLRHNSITILPNQLFLSRFRRNRIAQAMSIDQFLNPEDEVYDADEVIIDDIVTAYSTQERDYETVEEDVLQPRILKKEAIEALQKVRLYEEQQDDDDSGFISRLGRQERVMKQRTEQGHKQSTINSYFT